MSDTAAQIAVMQAYLEGKRIEWINTNDPEAVWKGTDKPGWTWGICDYRVAEERPREAEPWSAAIWLKESRRPILASSVHSAQHPNLIETGWRLTTVTEVPEGWEVRRKEQVRPLPEGVPQPPEGFDYWGLGPIPFPDEQWVSDKNVCGWGDKEWSDGWCGDGHRTPFAIKRGTELHRLNFEALRGGEGVV